MFETTINKTRRLTRMSEVLLSTHHICSNATTNAQFNTSYLPSCDNMPINSFRDTVKAVEYPEQEFSKGELLFWVRGVGGWMPN